MWLLSYLFGTAGRFRRRDYWLVSLTCVGINYLMIPFLQDTSNALQALDPQQGPGLDMLPTIVTVLLYCFFMIWISVSAAIKRFHDMGNSGWKVLWIFAPFIQVYFIIKLALFRGHPVPNAYGPPRR